MAKLEETSILDYFSKKPTHGPAVLRPDRPTQARRAATRSEANSRLPVQQLPFELLSEVMRLAVEMTIPKPYLWKTLEYVRGLSRVCWRWRDVALRTPQLWLLEYSEATGYPLSPLTELFLERSKPLPFRVVLASPNHGAYDDDDEDDESWNPDLSDLIATGFGETIDRWGDLVLQIRDRSELTDLAELPRNRAASLKKLDVFVRLLKGSWQGPPLDMFATAPRLTEVKLRLHFLEDPVVVMLPLPWAQLTTLTVQFDTAQSTLDVLACCPALESLAICLPAAPQISSQNFPNLRLARVKTLELNITSTSTGGCLYPFLSALDLPALESFHFEVYPLAFEWFYDGFTTTIERFLSRSPAISSFAFVFLPTPAAQALVQFLRLMPALKRLKLTSILAEEFLDVLQHPPIDGGKTLVPLLEDLEITAFGHRYLQLVEWTEARLLEMLSSRWVGAGSDTSSSILRLRRCRFEADGLKPLSTDFLEKMGKMEEEGFVWDYVVIHGEDASDWSDSDDDHSE
uniref:F-box domain-containing protein n=1 Tax=Mycena chlorophos TaxID=658473 RepID=A0ABQ0LX56_MYCCL|nr:predicted protein [Mycena chlorophos]